MDWMYQRLGAGEVKKMERMDGEKLIKGCKVSDR
jgi:hypothetical protein